LIITSGVHFEGLASWAKTCAGANIKNAIHKKAVGQFANGVNWEWQQRLLKRITRLLSGMTWGKQVTYQENDEFYPYLFNGAINRLTLWQALSIVSTRLLL
jgi:hypothetical protein